MWKPAYTQSPSHYQELYKKAQHWFQTQPDSAIYYAHKALNATHKSTEQAYAHELIAYYSQHVGYYGMAMQHYKLAYELYHTTSQKASMLNNMAFCHKNAGNYSSAINMATEATKLFSALGDSTKMLHAYNLLANCYRTNTNFADADSTYHKALPLAKRLGTRYDLANLYDDLSKLKERLNDYTTAIHYQKLALDTAPKHKHPIKKITRLSRLVQLCLFVGNTDLADSYMAQANTIDAKTSKALVQLYATRGLFYINKQDEIAARESYKHCDSLLLILSDHSENLLQQKYAHKTGYEMYCRAWWLSEKLWLGNKPKFQSIKDWARNRMETEKKLYENAKHMMNTKDALEIERHRPKTQIIRQVSLWWLLIIALVVIIGGILIYHKHLQKLRAHTNFIKAIKASPVKGFEALTQQEVSMLQNIEKCITGKLNTNDIKILVMVARSYKYAQISVAVGLQVGTIKSRIKRLKDQCQVENIRDLMH
jgi:tetratricopeptide (TPR) repeat protein